MFFLYSANTLYNAIANTANIYDFFANTITANINVTTFLISNTYPNSNQTVMQVMANNSNGISLLPVSLGAANTGGTGFRALVVPN